MQSSKCSISPLRCKICADHFVKSDLFDEISLYDLVHVPGIATDLMHIDTRAKVTGYLPADGGLKKTLIGADVIVVTAGIARKPGMTRDGKLSHDSYEYSEAKLTRRC